MGVSDFLFVCLLGALPGPPSVSINDAIVQLYPINKHKCHKIDPIRDIAFQLYTVHNPLEAQNLIIGDDKLLAESYFNFSQPTVFYFHAFFESSSTTSATQIRTAYLQRGGYNIILLNAPRLEAGPWYYTAARNTQIVGEYTAKLIDYLVSRGMHLPSLHLIGLSLGAQMAGVCGQSVKSGRIFRITGLDPAGPLFKKWPKSLRLDKDDAEFVDVIHSDAGIFGFPRSLGHVDFWPNRGISPQPGCTKSEVKVTLPDNVIALLFCSHWRSYQFYAESVINPQGFVSVPCDSWQDYLNGECRPTAPVSNMGFNVDLNARGDYYLRTSSQSPFSLE
ncbi:lipase member H-B-like [Tribolium madens]|uniref:lipase member H-B-like n=1 Tax=Tribolium madens TaxID=41895 RepID=UPI001CF7289B|nr:lipase member H-B-like [Tribolium madens]